MLHFLWNVHTLMPDGAKNLCRQHDLMQAEIQRISFPNCVYVNTLFFSFAVTVLSGDKAPTEFDWLAGAKVAQEKGLVAGSTGDQAPTARLEHRPGFACKFGIATATGARLRNALSGPRPRHPTGGSVSQKFVSEQNRRSIPVRPATRHFSDQNRAVMDFEGFKPPPPLTVNFELVVFFP